MDPKTEALKRAISALWPELPGLVGDAWPEFEAQLRAALKELDGDPGNAALPRAKILALFGQHPRAHQRLVALMAAARSEGTRGWTAAW